MQKVFVSYKLKEGVSLERYTAWSRDVDQRITPGQAGVIRFEVYAIEGAENGAPFCQIVEDIEVESWEVFAKTVAGPGMSYILETIKDLVRVDHADDLRLADPAGVAAVRQPPARPSRLRGLP